MSVIVAERGKPSPAEKPVVIVKTLSADDEKRRTEARKSKRKGA